MNKTKLFHFGFLAFSLFGLLACKSRVPPHIFVTADLSGTVVDKKSKKPIEGVLVTAAFGAGRFMGERSEVQGVVLTNAAGKYLIAHKHMESIPNYTYLRTTVMIEFTAIGYCRFGRMTTPTADPMLIELNKDDCYVVNSEEFATEKAVMEEREELTNKRIVTHDP